MIMADSKTGRPDFNQLVEQHSSELFAYLYRQMAGRMDAEDCLQETLLRGFRAYHQTEPDSNYRAWLYAIATNVARTHFRRRNRRTERELPLDNVAAGDERGPAQIVERRIDLARVRRAIDELPEKQRTALILRKYQELSYAEIAAVLGCSPESARANVYQGLRSLRKMLAVRATEVGDD